MQVAATLPLPLPLTLPLPLPLPLTLTLTLALTLALALALAPTRCKAQYTITKDRSSGKYACYGKFNPNERKWEEHANSPHDGATTIWQMDWPAVGGGGSGELSEEELFVRMCAWDDSNYILGAGTRAGSDRDSNSNPNPDSTLTLT